ncbi:hypothetical protein GGR56DRAFT_511367 [Xylariaceae sp. FL0804]|nr:hypothetical protein GGR56DRAFT_511367 [Xylariaceae sp. FL0804]
MGQGSSQLNEEYFDESDDQLKTERSIAPFQRRSISRSLSDSDVEVKREPSAPPPDDTSLPFTPARLMKIERESSFAPELPASDPRLPFLPDPPLESDVPSARLIPEDQQLPTSSGSPDTSNRSHSMSDQLATEEERRKAKRERKAARRAARLGRERTDAAPEGDNEPTPTQDHMPPPPVIPESPPQDLRTQSPRVRSSDAIQLSSPEAARSAKRGHRKTRRSSKLAKEPAQEANEGNHVAIAERHDGTPVRRLNPEDEVPDLSGGDAAEQLSADEEPRQAKEEKKAQRQARRERKKASRAARLDEEGADGASHVDHESDADQVDSTAGAPADDAAYGSVDDAVEGLENSNAAAEDVADAATSSTKHDGVNDDYDFVPSDAAADDTPSTNADATVETSASSKKRKRKAGEASEPGTTRKKPKRTHRKSSGIEVSSSPPATNGSLPVRSGGPLDFSELRALGQAIERWRDDHDKTQYEVNEIIHGDPRQSLAHEFWEVILATCPQRPRQKVINTCRRKWHNFAARGTWTPEQHAELKRYYEQYGPKYTKIGKIINRYSEDVRDRVRNYILCGDERRTDEWATHEEKQLEAIVVRALNDIRDTLGKQGMPLPDPLDKLVDWQIVSEQMGRTRSRLQCIEKWKRMSKHAKTVGDDHGDDGHGSDDRGDDDRGDDDHGDDDHGDDDDGDDDHGDDDDNDAPTHREGSADLGLK